MPVDYVFLHGGKQGGWVWGETIAALRAQAPSEVGKVLALDIPGCGAKRGRETDDLTFEAIIQELADDVRASGVRDAVLVGHSQAGTALPRLLEAAAHAFRRAVYVSCCAPAPGQTVAQMMGASVHGSSPDEVGWPADPALGFDALFPLMFCNDMSEAQQRAFVGKLGSDEWPAASATEDAWRYGGAPQIPSTYVICLDDGILTVPWQIRFAERFGADARVDVQAGHQVMNTRPHTLAEVLRFEANRGA
jgi:pimeloyl-ACP methyl ester carboxylesterase